MTKATQALPEEVSVEIGLETPQDPASLRGTVARQLGVQPGELPTLVLRKRSLDCRRGRVRYHLLFELVPADPESHGFGFGVTEETDLGAPHPVEVQPSAPVVIVGDGPCGLFCAYELARAGVGS